LPEFAADPNKWMRTRIIHAIGESLSSLPGSAQQILTYFADDKVARVRRALIDVISEHYESLPETVRDLVIPLSKDVDEDVRLQATKVLRDRYQSIPFPGLELLAQDPLPDARAVIAELLIDRYSELPREGHLLVHQLACDKSDVVRACISAGLARETTIIPVEEHNLLKLFLRMRESDPQLRLGAAISVWDERAQLPDQALNVWEVLAHDEHPEVRAGVAQLALRALHESTTT
jgi:hypothetical protein